MNWYKILDAFQFSELKNKPKSYTTLFFSLLALNLSLENFGPLNPELTRVLLLICMLFILSLNVGSSFLKKKFSFFYVALVLISFVFVVLFQQKYVIASMVSLLLFALDAEEGKQNVFSVFIFAIIVLQILLENFFFLQIRDFSMIFTETIGNVIHNPISLGPSVSGLWILISFVCFVCLATILTRNFKKGLLSILSILVGYIIFIVIHALFLGNAAVASNMQILLFLILFPFLLTFCGSYTNSMVLYPKLKKSFSVCISIFLFFSLFLCFTFPHQDENVTQRSVFVYKGGYLDDFSTPNFERYGAVGSGIFGSFMKYLEAEGYNVTLSDKLNFDCDVMVFINLNESFDRNKLKSIWRFVEDGGSLLVLGDHTDIGGSMKPQNDLLNPFGISFRFDISDPVEDHEWLDCLDIRYHPATFGITIPDQIQIGGGASLNLQGGAKPLIIGKFAFSDMGNYSNTGFGAYLGDRVYERGETLGDTILAAYTHYGNGKVMVFGDTSPFQNPSLEFSWQFLSSVFNWLTDENDFTPTPYLLLAFFLIFLLFILFFKNEKIVVVLISVVIIASLAIPAINSSRVENKTLNRKISIDTSHIEKFNIKMLTNDSIEGLGLNVLRNDYFPVVGPMDLSASAIVLIAPLKPLKTNEVHELIKYMQKGGKIILSVGYDDKEGVDNLLKALSIEILNIPLGPLPLKELENPQEYFNETKFFEAWPITGLDDIYYSFSYNSLEYPIVGYKRCGMGGLIMIGDSSFLLDKNLESEQWWWEGNILFVKKIFEEAI